MNPKSWKPRIKIAGKWTENRYRFHTRKGAVACAESFGARFAANKGWDIGECTAAPSDDPPNQDDDDEEVEDGRDDE